MKTLLFTLLLIGSLASPSLRAQTLAPEDVDKAVTYLEQTRAGVVEATKGLTEAQWNFKQAPDRWSVAQVTEHIAASEDLLLGMIQSRVMTAPARTQPEDVKALDALVLQLIPDRSHKVQAPAPLQPNNRYGSPEESLKHFLESRAKTIEFVKTTAGLRQHVYSMPPLNRNFDAYEWVLYIAAHSERHTKQIDEIKADPNFPKS